MSHHPSLQQPAHGPHHPGRGNCRPHRTGPWQPVAEPRQLKRQRRGPHRTGNHAPHRQSRHPRRPRGRRRQQHDRAYTGKIEESAAQIMANFEMSSKSMLHNLQTGGTEYTDRIAQAANALSSDLGQYSTAVRTPSAAPPMPLPPPMTRPTAAPWRSSTPPRRCLKTPPKPWASAWPTAQHGGEPAAVVGCLDQRPAGLHQRNDFRPPQGIVGHRGAPAAGNRRGREPEHRQLHRLVQTA